MHNLATNSNGSETFTHPVCGTAVVAEAHLGVGRVVKCSVNTPDAHLTPLHCQANREDSVSLALLLGHISYIMVHSPASPHSYTKPNSSSCLLLPVPHIPSMLLSFLNSGLSSRMQPRSCEARPSPLLVRAIKSLKNTPLIQLLST